MDATVAGRWRERLKRGGEKAGEIGGREWSGEIKKIMKDEIKSEFANLTKAISRILQTIIHIPLDD